MFAGFHDHGLGVFLAHAGHLGEFVNGQVSQVVAGVHAAIGELAGARRIASDLIDKLTAIESRLVARARLTRAKTG